MDKHTILNTIKESFEQWYNTNVNTNKSKVSAVIAFSDEQTLLIKAYHKITIRLVVIGIKDNLSYTIPITEVSGHYNHGITSEEEAFNISLKQFLNSIYSYCYKN